MCDKRTIFLSNIKNSLSRTEPGSNLGGRSSLFKDFLKLKISILEVDNNALLALIF